ncbi:DUF481 domain-containing protein [Algoriphagus namhaensis]|uniref:DUF481 domain-containing protein n=1 Tax=Algoriphagus namhaensis TaxID=915353 RepID=A0ABV8AMC6_9BACT
MSFNNQFSRSLALILVLFGASLTWSNIFAQEVKDSLRMSNGDILVGQIKSMDNGILEIDVPYSKKNIELDWKEVVYFSSDFDVVLSLEKEIRLRGLLSSISPDSLRFVVLEPINVPKSQIDSFPDTLYLHNTEIVEIQEVEENVFDRINGEISVGVNLARSSRLRQYSLRSKADYLSNWFGASANFNGIRSTQTDSELIQRYDGGLSFLALIRYEWFAITRVNFLNNSEQLIDLRSDIKFGIGKYLIRKYQRTVSLQAGINLNSENFKGDIPSNQSTEFVLGSTVDLFNMGDFSLQGVFLGYVGLTEKGRFRSDSKFDINYKFFNDFFLKLGTTINFDNKAAEDAPNLDYVIQTTIGWKF